MKYVTKQQTDLIRKEVQRRGIKLPDLEEDIVDFICTAVEHELESEPNFDFALENVFATIKPLELQLAQQTTEALLSNKVGLLQRLAYISLAFLGLGLLLLIFAMPFGRTVLFVSATSLAVLYLYSNLRWYYTLDAFRIRHKLLVSIVAFLSVVLFLGSVFKLLHLPGASWMLIGSVVPLLVAPLYISVHFFIRKKDTWRQYAFIEKHTPKVEGGLLVLVLIGFSARFLLINYLGNILLITALFGFSVLFLSYTWHFYVRENTRAYRILLLSSSTLAYILFLATGLFKLMGWKLLPLGLSNLPFLLLALLALLWYGKCFVSQLNLQSVLLFISSAIFGAYALLLFLRQSQRETFVEYVYNGPVLLLLVGLLVVFYQHQLFKVLAISLLAYYLLAYPYALMPNRKVILTVYHYDPQFIELYQKRYTDSVSDQYWKQLLEYKHQPRKL